MVELISDSSAASPSIGPLLFDGHLDMAMNALRYDRDQTLSVAELRRREAALRLNDREAATVALPEMRRSRVTAFIGTLFAKSSVVGGVPVDAESRRAAVWDVVRRESGVHASPSLAAAAAHGQLAYYRWLERQRCIRLVHEGPVLAGLFERAAADDPAPIGCILLMEGADPIVQVADLAEWRREGLAAVALVHYGENRFASGTGSEGPVTPLGRDLLKEMERLGVVLDVSHLSDQSFFEAMDAFGGRVCATHSNARALAPYGNRQLTDRQLRLLAERDAVIGVVLHNGMLDSAWRQEDATRPIVTLERVAEHVDHICQLLGSSRHVGIGSDLDGGFGAASSPHEIDTIADLPRLGVGLAKRGFDAGDLSQLEHGNWLRFWGEALPGEPLSPTPAG